MKLVGKHIYIRLYKTDDANELANLHIRNREFFQRVCPLLPEVFYTEEHQKIRLEQALKKTTEGQVYPFGIFLRENDKMKVILGNCEDDYVAYFDKICS